MSKKLIFIIVGLVVILGATSFFIFLSGNGKYTFQEIQNGTFKRTVEVSGKVAPIRDAHLGFETAGTVNGILAEVGDTVSRGSVLIKLDASSIRSQLSKAQADLQAEIVTLNDLSSQDQGSTELRSSKKSVIASLQDAYATADNAIKSKTDQFFKYEVTNNFSPLIIEAVQGHNVEAFLINSSVNKQRWQIAKILPVWGGLVRDLTIDNLTEDDIEYTKDQLEVVLDFLDDAVTATNYFDSGTVLTEAQVTTYREAASLARSNVQSSYSDVLSKAESLRSVSSQIPVQQTKVTSASANVEDFQVQLSKTEIRAPFDGVISQQDAEIGEITQPGISLVSMIGSEGLKLEVFIPEVNIADVEIGQNASVTLDAYGPGVVFEAEVVMIDPAETEKEGISTYKTTFHFKEGENRIKSGMTADVVVITDQRENILLLPRRSVIEEDGSQYVFVEENGEIIRKAIQVGAKDSFGNFEVIGGVEQGAKVVLNPES